MDDPQRKTRDPPPGAEAFDPGVQHCEDLQTTQSTQIGRAIINVFCGHLILSIRIVAVHEVLKIQSAK